ncbi:DUF2325 domain-containing protein [Exiguobacterium artemiae]|uniref:DUF2325 domain-containing protein n=1 Tax=Exiguobacterium artemiae TaxID=340145 RepID=UPI002963F22D|nr:DUF2325 domain-containing protein [Exiguobacterium sibiricum]MDW2885156.1 DUF2325 domain-containing protein [Exiguobacterium sibiricum]
MMQQIVEQAKTLVAGKMKVVETVEEWDLLLEEIRGVDEWVQMSRYYTPSAKPDIAWSEPEEEVTFEQSVIPPAQINPVIEQRYAYTFVRELKGGSLREWPNSHISETEIRQWNLEHGMEIRVQVVHQDSRRTTLEVMAVVATDRMKPLSERIVFEKCIVKNHGIIESTVEGPLKDETGKSFYYATPVEDMRFFHLKEGQLVDLVMWKGRPETLTIAWKYPFQYEEPTVQLLETSNSPTTPGPSSVEPTHGSAVKKSGRYLKQMKRKSKVKQEQKTRRIREKKSRPLTPLVTTSVPGQPIDFLDKEPLDFAPFEGMRLVIVGNEQQAPVYRTFFEKTGIELIHLSGDAQSAKKIASLAKKTDAIVVVTSRVSHAASAHVIAQAKKHDISFAMERLDGRRSLYTACQRQLEKARLNQLKTGKS